MKLRILTIIAALLALALPDADAQGIRPMRPGHNHPSSPDAFRGIGLTFGYVNSN